MMSSSAVSTSVLADAGTAVPILVAVSTATRILLMQWFAMAPPSLCLPVTRNRPSPKSADLLSKIAQIYRLTIFRTRGARAGPL
ncbi:hypothetical protein NSPZN2_40116 [Nitrospira defluvii]|uniref:Secreted protein n=1 Tax=Nitrospira defluvii TaxID=330214 RepID=A0ABM8RRI9_9BACT|nr:hypothetical protein NSPZN2_40116 [Nitrospira defluvii]